MPQKSEKGEFLCCNIQQKAIQTAPMDTNVMAENLDTILPSHTAFILPVDFGRNCLLGKEAGSKTALSNRSIMSSTNVHHKCNFEFPNSCIKEVKKNR